MSDKEKALAALFLLFALAACSGHSKLGLGDVADLATTNIGLNIGATELNPLIPDSGGPEAIAAGIALKVGVREALIATGTPPEDANREANAASWGAACWNAAQIMSATVPISAAIGIVCYGEARK